MDPLGDPLTTHPVQTGWELCIELYPDWWFGWIDNPDRQFGNGLGLTRTWTRRNGMELLLTICHRGLLPRSGSLYRTSDCWFSVISTSGELLQHQHGTQATLCKVTIGQDEYLAAGDEVSVYSSTLLEVMICPSPRISSVFLSRFAIFCWHCSLPQQCSYVTEGCLLPVRSWWIMHIISIPNDVGRWRVSVMRCMFVIECQPSWGLDFLPLAVILQGLNSAEGGFWAW